MSINLIKLNTTAERTDRRSSWLASDDEDKQNMARKEEERK